MRAGRNIILAVLVTGLGAIAGECRALASPDPNYETYSEAFPEPVHKEVATYPDAAYRAYAEGTVIVRTLIAKDGTVKRAEVERSARMFDDAALAAARKWTFQRPVYDGHAIEVWVRIPFRFELGDPATDPRVQSDSLWRDRLSATPAIMQQQRESLLHTILNATEVWLFRLDPNERPDEIRINPRSRFGHRVILDEADIEAAPMRTKLLTLLADPRTHAKPPRVRGEFSPSLGVRFIAGTEVLDVVLSFADAAIFLKGGGRLWAGSAEPHWREWGQIAHAAFPADPNFARYAAHDPREP
jgi:TonB family protein